MIEDLKLLWDYGLELFDEFANESFYIHAMLCCIINEFPTYENMSQYSVKGHIACPICEEICDMSN